MKPSKFRHYSLNQATRNTLSISKFGGVDYSTQKFLVATGRAIDLKNYIYKDGVVQKRNGIEEMLKVSDFSYVPADFDNPTSPISGEIHSNADSYEKTNDTKIDPNKTYYRRILIRSVSPIYEKVENPDVLELSDYYELFTYKQINGIWKFKAEDNEEHIIAHIGKLLYEIKNIEDNNTIACLPIVVGTTNVNGVIRSLAYEFENYKSFAYVGGNKLWFQGGNKYIIIRFIGGNTIVKKVEDSEFAPIPVTTISITYKNAIAGSRQSLDNVNLLTKWRINKMISGSLKQEDEKTKTTFYEYVLDAPLITKKTSDMADIELEIKESGVVL